MNEERFVFTLIFAAALAACGGTVPIVVTGLPNNDDTFAALRRGALASQCRVFDHNGGDYTLALDCDGGDETIVLKGVDADVGAMCSDRTNHEECLSFVRQLATRGAQGTVAEATP